MGIIEKNMIFDSKEKKRIGILTVHSNANPGSMLQAYALQTSITKILNERCNCEIINYMIPNLFWGRSQGSILPIRILIWLYFKYANKKYLEFGNKYLKLYPSKRIKPKKLSNYSNLYDAVIVGSDQIWNTRAGAYWDPNYLLDWVDKKTLKISYAASFGTDELENEWYDRFKKALLSFHALSVRENNGVHIINCLIKNKVEWVLDPTLLLDKNYWSKIAIRPKETNYIFVYCINRSRKTEQLIREMSAKTGMEIVQCTVGLKSLLSGVKTIRFISPEEWMGYMLYSNYAVVSSFHGTAFAINFNKQFIVDTGDYRGSRMKSILKLFALEDRIITQDMQIDTIKTIDFVPVNEKLQKEREKSISYLKTALQNNHG